MYTKHHTNALILTGYDTGEADRIYSLLTPDLGKVYAKAHGVRAHHSRHKPSLQTLSEAQVSLIRGKAGWRITNVTPIRSLYVSLASDTEKLSLMVRIVRLVKRLVTGEGSGEQTFAVVASFSDALAGRDFSPRDLKSLETLCVMRLMATLGYLKHEPSFAPFLEDQENFSPETLIAFSPQVPNVVRALNESLEATHL